MADLDRESLEIFRREAVKNGRMTRDDLKISDEELLDHLDLMVDGKLKRAAVMLFYRRPGRIISGCYVKIGKFGKGADLQYQDTVEGSLFYIADRIIDLIYTKYLKAAITYEHDIRVETFPFPRDGLREAIYNALAHNNYAASVPIQIRIEDDALYISNSCVLPREWTVDTLLSVHKSVPFNPSIANTLYRAGYIEAWGRGIQKIVESCRALGSAEPEYTVLGDDLTVKFMALERVETAIPNTPNRHNGGMAGRIDAGLAERIFDAIKHNPSMTQDNIAKTLGLPLRTLQREMSELQKANKIKRIGGNRYGHWEIVKE